MCGIAGIVWHERQRDPTAIERMVAAQRHRGPDAEGVLSLEGVDLGHTRLCVIDPAGGAQPMSDPTGRYHIAFNGEIYNYRELRRTLESAGPCLQTDSDTEVLLRGFMQWGPAVVQRLNGQFAFAIWDAREHELFAARDRLGEKPLYHAPLAQGLVLASELKALIASQLIDPELDAAAIDLYLGLFYVPPDRTVYTNVQCLPPAHTLRWRRGRTSIDRYWQPRLSGASCNEQEAAEHIAALLDRAVHRQMVADVPIGAFLSGGLDSTTIVALMSRHHHEPVRSFAVGFGDLINELPFARDAAAMHRCNHHEMEMDIDVGAMLERMCGVYDEPFADSSNIPTYLVAEFARRQVKVVLSGDGGDELFGGYSWYQPLLDAIDPSGDHDTGADNSIWQRHLLGPATRLAADRAALWGHPIDDALAMLRRSYGPKTELLGIDQAVHFDIHCYLPGDILRKVDRAAMAHGLETRAPFLDVELVEFVWSLPATMRFGGSAPRMLLRQACGHLWPASIRSRDKQGFGAPVRAWLDRADVTALWQRVMRKGHVLSDLLPGAAKVGPTLRPQQRWTLLCLGLWLETHGTCRVNRSSA